MPFFKRKYILLLFSAIILMTFSPFSFSQSKSIVKLNTVVIDPGHGGKDPGTLNGKVYEKDIVLSVALKLGEMIKTNYPEVKVIYTRSTDTYLTLNQRTTIANKNNADLFISIHINGSKSSSAKGVESFVMGMDKGNANMEVCQLENSVITLEDDYSSNYSGFDPNNPESYIIFSLLQNSHLEQSLILAANIQEELKKGPIRTDRGVKQAPYLVLWQCTMPSVLVELGFITNTSDYNELINKKNHTVMANSIYKAFNKYKLQYDTTIEVAEKRGPSSNYKIQVMALSKSLAKGAKEFKGVELDCTKSGDVYKYTYGNYQTKQEAETDLIKIKKLFQNAYIIKETY